MGWAHGTLPDGREVGYAVETTCEHPGCGTAIDRGLSYLCGEMHGQDDDACGHYFCAEHLYHTDAGQRCQPCADAPTDNQGDTPMISPTPEHDKALSFHPLTPGRGEVHELLRSAAKVLAAVYDNHLPASREASLAFTAVQESLMWANAAVAIHTPAPGISGTDD